MKRYIKATMQPAQTTGTTFYRVELDDVIDYFSEKSQNVWLYKSFSELGWGALDFGGHLYGSFIKNNVLYICVTDGTKIRYRDKFVDPYKLPRNAKVEDIQKYVALGNDKIIHRYITPYELVRPKFDKWTDELLEEGYTEKKLFKDAEIFDEL